MDTDSKGDEDTTSSSSSSSSATPPTDPAPLLSALRDASSTEQVSAALTTLAGAVVARSITVTKAELLVAAKAARAGLAAGGGEGGLWTKDCAIALKAVLQAFGKSGGIEARAQLEVGSIVAVSKPLIGSPKLSLVLSLDEAEGVVEVQMLRDDVCEVPWGSARPLAGRAREIAAMAIAFDASSGTTAELADGVVRPGRETNAGEAEAEAAGAAEAALLGIYNLCFKSDVNRRTVVEAGGMDLIFESLARFDVDARVYTAAFRAVQNLCFNVQSNKVIVVEKGGLALGVAALKKFEGTPHDADVVSSVCYALQNVASNSQENKTKLAQEVR